jgi:hypothetical protein
MVTDEFTLAEAQAKRGQIVRTRPSVPRPDGVLGEIVEVDFSQFSDGHSSDRFVFTVVWQLFPEYGAVPCTAISLSKSQYQDYFQEIWLTEADQHRTFFGEHRTPPGDGGPSRNTR